MLLCWLNAPYVSVLYCLHSDLELSAVATILDIKIAVARFKEGDAEANFFMLGSGGSYLEVRPQSFYNNDDTLPS